ncbi:hypothetical protein E8E11_010643 [Didymella keratinophila]|nr:hypothetical protein E8E11_010643 [Didymella keratinophila]
MSRQPEHSSEWSLYFSYDSCLPPKTVSTPQEDELYDSDTLSTDVQNGDMSSSRESSSTADSLYAMPSPRTRRYIAQNSQIKSEYTSLRDVPPLSLDGASDPAAHRGTSMSSKTPSTALPPALYRPCYNKYEGSFVPAESLSDGTSKIRLKEKSTRGTIGFTNPCVEKKQEHPMASLEATLTEKRGVNAELDDMTQQLQNVFKEFHKAEKLGKQLSSQSPIADGQSTCTGYRSVFDAPPSRKVLAGSLRLPNCYTYMYNGAARHLHDIEEEKRHKETLERRAEDEILQRRKQEQERLRAQEELRCQTQSMGYGTRTPVIARTPTTTWIEDAHDAQSNDHQYATLATPASAKAAVQAAINSAPPKPDSKAELKAAPATSTPIASKIKPESFASPVALVNCSSPSVPSSDASAKSPAWYSHADCVQALGKTDTATKAPSSSPKTKEQKEGRMRLRKAARKILAAQEQAEEDAQWDNVDLSDDEEWDKVAAGEGEEWEVLEK